MQVLNPQGCRSLDPDFPISLRGSFAPATPRFIWELPHDPFASSCGYLDRDADGVLDWAEAELAWVFRPFLVFDNDETYAGKYDDTWMNGVTVYYQIHPVEQSMDGVTSAGPDLRLLKLKLIIAFRRDLTHDGDTETFEMELSGIREPWTSRFTRWRIHALKAGNCSDPSACALHRGWADERVLSMSENGEFRYYNPSIFYNPDYISYPLNTQVYLAEYGVTETGTPCGQVSGTTPGSSGICLPKLYIAKNKHRPYLFKEICEGCCHGIERDNCDGGIQMAACYGLPGAAVQQDEWRSGFEMLPQYLLHQGSQAFSWRSPVYADTLVQYLGNLGEKHYTMRQMDESVRLRTLACRKVLESGNGYFEWPVSPRVCFGDALHHYLARMEQEEDCETACFSDPSCAGTSVVGEDLPNPAFLHYSTPHWGILELNTCITVDPDLLGMGTLSRQHANTDPLVARNQYFGVAGLYSNYPREPGSQTRQEFLFDFWSSVFCGSKSCDAQFMSEVAAGLKGKISVMPDADAYLTCPAIFFQDTDQDGAPDEWDCDPLHPYLRWDLDQDSHCDEPVEDATACVAVCGLLYPEVPGPIIGPMPGSDGQYSDCLVQCNLPDNCSPLRSQIGVSWPTHHPAYACRDLMERFDSGLMFRCREWFRNPHQEDVDGNQVGDFCEGFLSDARVEVRDAFFGSSKGRFVMCPDPDATLMVHLRADQDYPTEDRMLSVGFCACPAEGENSCRDKNVLPPEFYCPSDPALDMDENSGIDYSNKDFAWNSESRDNRYFYHPIEGRQSWELGGLSTNAQLRQLVDPAVPDQGLLARWKDVVFTGNDLFLNFRYGLHRLFGGFLSATMLSTFPDAPVDPLVNRYTKVRFSSPRPVSPDPTDDSWNPQAPGLQQAVVHVPPGTLYFDEDLHGGMCVSFPIPQRFPEGVEQGSPLLVDPLWDPPRDRVDRLLGWVRDDTGQMRLFTMDSAVLKVRTYVPLPAVPDVSKLDLRVLRVDADLVGGEPGRWATVVSVMHQGNLHLRSLEQQGPWTQVSTGIAPQWEVLAHHQMGPRTVWVISREKANSVPGVRVVDLRTGATVRSWDLPSWQKARVESVASGRMGEAYFLIRQPAHLHPSLWRLDKNGMNAAASLPAVFPPGRGALAVDGHSGRIYLVSRSAADQRTSLWEWDQVHGTWSLLSNTVPVGILREPRLVFSGGRLWFSDLKEGDVWAWVQGRWVSQGNPLKREVTP